METLSSMVCCASYCAVSESMGDVLSWQWIDYHERIVLQVWHTKQGVFRRKLPPRPSRGRAATCLHEKTRLARGDGSLSLGTYDAQTSCIPPKRSQDGIPPTMTTEGGCGRVHLCARCISGPISSKPRPRTTESLEHSLHCSHWRQSRTPGSLPLLPDKT